MFLAIGGVHEEFARKKSAFLRVSACGCSCYMFKDHGSGVMMQEDQTMLVEEAPSPRKKGV